MPTKNPTKMRAQVALARKAAARKAAGDAEKRRQSPWLRAMQRKLPALSDGTRPDSPERLHTANRSEGSPRLLAKPEVLDITGLSFPTVWAWMRAGTFPRSRVVGGKSMWLSSEVDAWLAALPVRRLKGDKPSEVA